MPRQEQRMHTDITKVIQAAFVGGMQDHDKNERHEVIPIRVQVGVQSQSFVPTYTKCQKE